MKHYGDVSKISGAEIEPVDVITFGSPCQDLSVAGKRAGLKHEANGDDETTRSGLFVEAVRIIKEMREATDGRYPSFALWENVPGAFSSNKGEDFRAVLDGLIKIVEPNAVMPQVPKAGWNYADSYSGDGWSLAYRVFDAQYWGVPQRRRRIHLVLDLRGERAREVLFEREGLRGYFAQSGTARQGTAADAQGGAGADDREGDGRRLDGVSKPIAYSFDSLDSNAMKSSNPHSGCRATEISKTLDTFHPNPSKRQGGMAVVEALPFDTTQITNPLNGNNPKWGDPCHPLAAQGHPPTVICKSQHLFENHSQDTRYKGPLDICPMLPAQLGTGGNNTPFVIEEGAPIYCLDGDKMGKAERAGGSGLGIRPGDNMYTLTAKDCHAVAYSVGNDAPPIQYIVRRLTPTECARLQGFADRWGEIDVFPDWTAEEFQFWLDVRNTHAAINGKTVKEYTEEQMLKWYNRLHTDSVEYKMWGNGIALPPALYCMQGIAYALEEVENDWML
jgi:DNA (cytosine-5)-methyltransferase 1